MDEQKTPETWAIAELMGHLTLAGRVTKPGEYGGLWQIDVPEGDTFHTEFFGSQGVYRIRIVSEEIARAYSKKNEVLEYSAPIVSREEHEAAMQTAQERIASLCQTVRNLQDQLAHMLPASTEPDDPEFEESHFDEDEDDDGTLPF